MMRFHQSTATALAALFVLPAAAQLGLGQKIDLERRLAATVGAIEGLLGVEQRAAAGDDTALEDVLAATEAPILDGPGRDLALTELRREVGRLHETLDGLTVYGTGANAAAAGLTDQEREQLRALQSPAEVVVPVASAVDVAPVDAAPARTAFERDPDYTADAVRQGRLSIRAGRELEAIELLEPLAAGDVEARYWLARAYDRALQVEKALALYDQLAADQGAGKYRDRADLDRGFLLVKQRLLAERAAAASKKGEGE